MKIKYVEIEGLNDNNEPIKLDFNDDLNIITGRNGAGKTTILKLIWYVISGNLYLILNEINFNVILLKTDIYILKIIKKEEHIGYSCDIEWIDSNGESSYFTDIYEDEVANDGTPFLRKILPAQREPIKKLKFIGNSIFFPTFRLIEGGFLTDRYSPHIPSLTDDTAIEKALKQTAKSLSSNNHIFISSVSLNDVKNLLLTKYAELSEQIATTQQEISNATLEKIQKSSKNSDIILDEVRQEVEQLNLVRQEIMLPFDVLNQQVFRFIKLSGIKISAYDKGLNLGNTLNAIDSDLLSAGEKQILSFLVYNTFYQDTIFIIDEPELSLHVDWQRQLFPTLMKQGSTNQFIVATHSPFIYSKFPDKELQITEDKGDNEEEA